MTLPASLSSAVDEEFYRFVYGAPPSGTTAAAHYADRGWRELRDPNPWFSTRAYLERYPDVARAGIPPLFHYLQQGFEEGRSAAPSDHAPAFHARLPEAGPESERGTPAAPEELVGPFAVEAQVVGPEFDAEFYLAMNPDVAAAAIDPLRHFVEQGWREGRDPNAFFSTASYQEINPDVAQAGMNPFYHYVLAGRGEGRRIRTELGFRYDILATLPTVEQRLAQSPKIAGWKIGGAGQLTRAFDSLARSDRRKLHVSVSHDDYTATVGGMQLSLLREADTFECRGVDHLHLYPARVMLFTDHDDEDPVTGVLLNGERVGLYRASTIAQVAGESFDVSREWPQRSLAIHSLLGHNPRALGDIFKRLGLRSGFFWIHDFAAVCAGLNLLRNDVEFCGGPPQQSTACTICVYGERRRVQVADHELLFGQVALTAVAAARVTLDKWKAAAPLPIAGELVHPHCRLIPRAVEAGQAVTRPLRIAYLGLPHAHKGWLIFLELVQRYGRDPRYEFHHLGKFPQRGLPIAFTEVDAGKEMPDAMAIAVEEREIDVALIWSLCAETFCLVAYEAVAGGAMVVAPENRGNLTQMVSDTGKGVVLSGEKALYELFESGPIFDLARSRRAVEHYSLEYSNMTADLVGPQWQ